MKARLIVVLAVLLMIGCAAAEQYVQINYAGTSYDKIGYSSPDPGKKFLVVDLAIENHGYDSVETNPYRFTVTIDNVEYDIAGASYSLDSIGKAKLDNVKLKDGGKISGSLAYQVPAATTSYSFRYTTYSWENYDVKYQ